ncbi:hypothetical protein IscW_ISCW017870 [Ixodes scapularis]|uniref:Uncharacterized protein n=1 Tax=Ixodes scapularis TaxID=6945 RepID=B7PH92_IXOSC|nr:hypothetical protein IscW_ISCW017870 [Ixodes scapularis]|eukprot:XP_002402358.1 hypothetical protein IscW_ISCW017870 [Ixodes scapularis]
MLETMKMMAADSGLRVITVKNATPRGLKDAREGSNYESELTANSHAARETPFGPTEPRKEESAPPEDTETAMISRRKILSRSRDELNVDFTTEDEEDVWYQKEKLFKVLMGKDSDSDVYSS